MFRSIQRKVNIPQLLQSRSFVSSRLALRTPITTIKSSLFVAPLKQFKSNQRPITQHGFHTCSPFFDQQQKSDPTEEQSVDPHHKMLIGFTCKVCEDRSHHVMSKHSYTKGVVLIQCPGCKNRHLIADNLGWFRDSKTTIEDLVKEKGEAIRRIVVGDDGVERMGDLMEWLPDIAQEEKVKKAEATLKANELKASQNKE